MQTLPDYDLDALFRSALASEAEELAPTAANESQMLERIAQALSRRRSRRQFATLLIAAVLVTLTAGAIALASDRLLPPVTPDPPLVLPASPDALSSNPASSSSEPTPSPSRTPDMITTTSVPNPIPLDVDLPAEWQSHDEDTGHTVWVHDGLSSWSEIGFYFIDDLLVDPCVPADGFRDPPIGPTAADLVDELMSLPAYRDSTTNQVQVGGLSATLIVTPQDPFPAVVDACDPNLLGQGGHIHNPNEVAGLMQLGAYPRVWLVDVDGHRLVVVTEGQRVDEIDSILQSVRFEP